jgi:hypothetical protein
MGSSRTADDNKVPMRTKPCEPERSAWISSCARCTSDSICRACRTRASPYTVGAMPRCERAKSCTPKAASSSAMARVAAGCVRLASWAALRSDSDSPSASSSTSWRNLSRKGKTEASGMVTGVVGMAMAVAVAGTVGATVGVVVVG